MTWFRKMEREGVEINWFDTQEYRDVKSFVAEKLGNYASLS